MKKTILLILLTAGMLPAAAAQDRGLSNLDFFIGEWAMETIDIQRDGSFVHGRARSEVKYILDGQAIQDNFLSLDQHNQVVFRGLSIRSYNATSGKFQIVWVMPGHLGITDLEGEWKDGKLVSTGKGYDQYGEFVERFEYYDITEDSYSFRMDRSYDGGRTWIENFGRIRATRIR